MSAWFREICKVTIGDIAHTKREMISVDAATQICEVMDLMKWENIISVGVYGRPGSWLGSGGVNLISHNKQYIGIASILDILAFLQSGADLNQRLHHRIVEVIGSTNESMTLWIEPYSRPLYFALEQFCKGLINHFYSLSHILCRHTPCHSLR
jgi:hypothetical protein